MALFIPSALNLQPSTCFKGRSIMRSALICAAAWTMMAAAAAAAEPPPPTFAKRPAVARDGEGVRIEFAADRETDVAVCIENAKGEIVRHLVAGALGRNPPAPLRPGLAQSLDWNGLDDGGRKAEGGPFRARVGLGLMASWGGVAFAG